MDRIDAICKGSGSFARASSIHNTVLDELLSRIDSLNNILIIGITDHTETIAEALLRPGRMEVAFLL